MPQEVGGWGYYLEEMAFKLNFDRTSIGREVGKKFKMRERHRSRTVYGCLRYSREPHVSGQDDWVGATECSSWVLGLCSAGSGVLTKIPGQKGLDHSVNVGKRKIRFRRGRLVISENTVQMDMSDPDLE